MKANEIAKKYAGSMGSNEHGCARFDCSTECEKEIEQNIIGFVEWLTHEDSPYAIMYGNQSERFADNKTKYTIKELLDIYNK